MDDVAGCRLIFPNLEELHNFRANLHQAHFRHKRKNEADKYDYIKHPKDTGYRGIHDVYEYDVRSSSGQQYKGLLIEIQYRTIPQHAWATCVEVVGFISENQPKFESGDENIQEIFRLASEIISRTNERLFSCYPEMENSEVIKRFLTLDDKLNFMLMLRNLNSASGEITNQKNVILIFSETDDLEVRTYRGATDALRALFELEKEDTGQDIVLVKADKSEDVRIAFKNYFSDAEEFVRLIDEGCATLSPPPISLSV